MSENSSLLNQMDNSNIYQTINDTTKHSQTQLENLNESLIKERDELLKKIKMYNFVEIMFKFALGVSLIFVVIIGSIGLIKYPDQTMKFIGFNLQYFITKIREICGTISKILTSNSLWIILIFVCAVIYSNYVTIFVKICRNGTHGRSPRYETIEINVSKSNSILKLKGIIEHHSHIIQSNQILKLENGIELIDNRKIKDYSIMENQMIYLTLVDE